MVNKGEIENILRERESLCSILPVLCTGCKGFFSTAFKSRHQIICPATLDSFMMVPILNADHCLNATQDLSSGFSELLNTLRIDEVSDATKGDKILLMIGNRYFNSLKRKKDKKLSLIIAIFRSVNLCRIKSELNRGTYKNALRFVYYGLTFSRTFTETG